MQNLRLFTRDPYPLLGEDHSIHLLFLLSDGGRCLARNLGSNRLVNYTHITRYQTCRMWPLPFRGGGFPPLSKTRLDDV